MADKDTGKEKPNFSLTNNSHNYAVITSVHSSLRMEAMAIDCIHVPLCPSQGQSPDAR